jgi:hypothetical protein
MLTNTNANKIAKTVIADFGPPEEMEQCVSGLDGLHAYFNHADVPKEVKEAYKLISQFAGALEEVSEEEGF